MKSKLAWFSPAIICAAVLTPVPLTHASLTMTLSGTPGSPMIEVLFSGSAIVQSTIGPGSIINYGWSFVPTTFNPFPPQITGNDFGMFSFTSGAAQFINVTRSETSVITGVWLQDSSNSPTPGWERYGMLNPTPIGFTAGELYEWSGSGTIDLSAKGLTFDSLNPGTTGPISADLDFLEGQLVIVPEPSKTLFLSAAALAGAIRRAVKRRPCKNARIVLGRR